MILELSRQIFKKFSKIKFHENHFSGIRVWTEMKLIIGFYNFAKEPKNFSGRGCREN
jgi:hypothetical protein